MFFQVPDRTSSSTSTIKIVTHIESIVTHSESVVTQTDSVISQADSVVTSHGDLNVTVKIEALNVTGSEQDSTTLNVTLTIPPSYEPVEEVTVTLGSEPTTSPAFHDVSLSEETPLPPSESPTELLVETTTSPLPVMSTTQLLPESTTPESTTPESTTPESTTPESTTSTEAAMPESEPGTPETFSDVTSVTPPSEARTEMVVAETQPPVVTNELDLGMSESSTMETFVDLQSSISDPSLLAPASQIITEGTPSVIVGIEPSTASSWIEVEPSTVSESSPLIRIEPSTVSESSSSIGIEPSTALSLTGIEPSTVSESSPLIRIEPSTVSESSSSIGIEPSTALSLTGIEPSTVSESSALIGIEPSTASSLIGIEPSISESLSLIGIEPSTVSAHYTEVSSVSEEDFSSDAIQPGLNISSQLRELHLEQSDDEVAPVESHSAYQQPIPEQLIAKRYFLNLTL